MKTLKITFLLLAVVLLTVSGQSSETVIADNDEPTYKTQKQYDLMAHNKAKLKIPTGGFNKS